MELEKEDVILAVELEVQFFQVDQVVDQLEDQEMKILELLVKEIKVVMDTLLLELKKVEVVVELEVQVEMQVLLQQELVEMVQVLPLYLVQH